MFDALGERYLAYALSTITSRSLPDVKMGLSQSTADALCDAAIEIDPNQGFKNVLGGWRCY